MDAIVCWLFGVPRLERMMTSVEVRNVPKMMRVMWRVMMRWDGRGTADPMGTVSRASGCEAEDCCVPGAQGDDYCASLYGPESVCGGYGWLL